MHSSILMPVLVASLLTLVGAQTTTVPVTGLLGNATATKNNPVGDTYVAVLPSKEFLNPANPKGGVQGSVSAKANSNGEGVAFTVSFSNLPATGGPFLYHLHKLPVPSDGNCTGTGSHIDPFQRGDAPPCDPSLPETCQVGDLSGKYGKITSDPFTASYSDAYASTLEGSASFFGNGSITLHFANNTRLTCANFTLTASTSSGGTGSPNATSSTAPPSPTAPISASAKTMVPTVGMIALVALALML